MKENQEIEVVTTEEVANYHGEEAAAVDVQVATAHKYPRNLRKAIDNSIAVVTIDKETAEACGYTLPRGGKKISGASVHLARIIAQNYGNLRVESKVIATTNTQIVSQAVAFDLENNYAVKVEVRKKILDRNGKKYNEDMIVTTGNAANAIAYRNAVFAVVPKAITDKVYGAAKNMITGDMSSKEQLIARRKKALDFFEEEYGVNSDQILEVLGLNSVNQIKQDEIMSMIGMMNSIKDGDSSVADMFGSTKKEAEKKSQKVVDDIVTKVDNVKGKKDEKPKDGKLL